MDKKEINELGNAIVALQREAGRIKDSLAPERGDAVSHAIVRYFK